MNHRHHRTLVVLSLSVPVACVVATPPGDDPSAGSGESGISITDGITGNTEGSLSASGASAASASDTGGPVFDVGVETADGSAGDTMPTNGSCRSSEAFGAAGGFPAYTDPAYASFLDRQVLAMTSYAYLGDEAELRIFDISGAPPPPNLEYAAPMYIHPSWNGSTFGGGIDRKSVV